VSFGQSSCHTCDSSFTSATRTRGCLDCTIRWLPQGFELGCERGRGCWEGGLLYNSQASAFTFSSRLCLCRCFPILALLGITHFRTHSHLPVPYRIGLLQKIASIELRLHSLYLNLPQKAIRFELSSIWFQECTYLYLSHVSRYHGSSRRLRASRSM